MIGILVIPGRSIIVKSGQAGEYTDNKIGTFTIPLFFPHSLSVRSSIVYLTLSKSVNFCPFKA